MKTLLTIRSVTQVEIITGARKPFARKAIAHKNPKAYKRHPKHKGHE